MQKAKSEFTIIEKIYPKNILKVIHLLSFIATFDVEFTAQSIYLTGTICLHFVFDPYLFTSKLHQRH